jgi:hypothetical protein
MPWPIDTVGYLVERGDRLGCRFCGQRMGSRIKRSLNPHSSDDISIFATSATNLID